MIRRLGRILYNPVAFYRDMAEGAWADGAIWMVLLVSLVGAVSTYAVTLPQLQAFGEDAALGPFLLWSAVIFAFFASFIGWLVLGLVVRMTAGMDAKPWAVVAYAAAPRLVLELIPAAVVLLVSVEVTPIEAAPDGEGFSDALLRLQQEVGSSPVGITSLITTYLARAWQLALIYIGLRETSDASKALRSVVVIALLYGFVLAFPWLFGPLQGA
ncbi:MAG: YIP1 family protein [Trueperaceae bacterium]|nr:YIP1 family protein [Trueperaceae bacterium]